jgi:hypothetical protein
MALQNNDLFVIQSQTNNELYKLKLSDLAAELAAFPGVVFKGSVDLKTAPSAQTPPITSPNTGDLYFVDSDAPTINAGWSMAGGETSAVEGDRVIYDAATAKWSLITSGSDSVGTVKSVTASLPLESDGDNVDPVLSILQARTTTAATAAGDGKGTKGAVDRLAEASDVTATTGTGSTIAVVTADLLKSTNDAVAGLVAGGGATTITEGGTDIVVDALEITTGVANNVTIGVKENVFCPYDFSTLPDIT